MGQDLPDPLVIELRDSNTGEGLGNRAVSITVVSGMGSISGMSGGGASGDGATWTTHTEGSGRLSVFLGLGIEAGLHTFSVHTSVAVDGDSLIGVSAIAQAGPVERVVKSGDGQEGNAGSVLPVPIALLLSDRFGNPILGAEVSFGVTTGGGTVSESAVVTDVFGTAAVDWTLGAGVGENLVSAVVAGVGVFRFEAVAR